MNNEELTERIEILQSSDTITDLAAEVTKNAFEHLKLTLSKEDIEQGSMLFTHLPMALTRLEREEEIEKPHESVLKEALSTGYANQTNKEILFIEEQWGQTLPDAEKDYLYIHYSLIFQLNLGG
jgi:transcriptional regulatory protein LevR